MFITGRARKEEKDITFSDFWLLELLIALVISLIIAIISAIESGDFVSFIYNLKDKFELTVIGEGFTRLFSSITS